MTAPHLQLAQHLRRLALAERPILDEGARVPNRAYLERRLADYWKRHRELSHAPQSLRNHRALLRISEQIEKTQREIERLAEAKR